MKITFMRLLPSQTLLTDIEQISETNITRCIEINYPKYIDK